MGLTERERRILQLANQGFSDYRIAEMLKVSPPAVTKSHRSARKKLSNALADVEWAIKTGIDKTQLTEEIF
jgi:DNA-binding NarL/FixJ family response regulator